jgi:hypothetical protein
MICVTFTPDEGQPDCCGIITSSVVSVFSYSPPTVTYSFQLGATGSWTIQRDEEDLGCYWRLQIPALSIDEWHKIDHFESTSLSLPSVEITGFTVPGSVTDCVGTLSFSAYEPIKIPFINEENEIEPDYDINEPTPCNCKKAARSLCVTGIRHEGGDVEHVSFSWNEELSDRWEYTPPCTNPTLTKEIIYLRSDSDGNCYLELDLDRTGSDTNDWAVPSNTFDAGNPHEIRPGMLPVSGCSCDLYVPKTYSSDRLKWITIHSGPCSRWRYVCGNCRCAPQNLCVIGQIDGEFVEGTAEWEQIDGTFGWTMGSHRFVLGAGICPGNFPAQEGCAITYSGSAVTEFAMSDEVNCGKFISAELYPVYDPDTPNSDWIWLSASNCTTCKTENCGPCINERCGGPPRTLYVQLRARADPYLPYPGHPYPDCDLDVTVYYWHRWDITGPPIVICGYIGFSAIQYCGPNWFQIRVEMNDFGAALTLYRRDNLHTIDGVPYWYAVQLGDPLEVAPSDCDPYMFDTGWLPDPETVCYWGCDQKDDYRIIIVE